MAKDPRSESHGALANTAFALAAQATTSVFTAALTLYLVRALGPGDFGVFGLALGIGAIALLLADLGVSQSTARFIAEVRGDRPAVAGLLADALRLKIAISAAVAVVLIALADPIATAYDNPDLAWPLRGVALAVLGQGLVLFYLTAFQALGRIDRNVRVVFIESATETTASIALVALGADAAGAAFGRAIGYAVGVAVAIAVVVRLCGRAAVALRRREDARTREIMTYARPLLVTNSAYTLFSTLDVLLIGALLTSPAVGLFAAPLRFVTFLGSIGQAVGNAVAPRLAAHADGGRDVATFVATIRWLLLLQGLLVAAALVWSEPIVRLLFGEEFGESAGVLRALGPYILLVGLAPLITTGVNYLGQAGRRVPIVAAAVLVNAAIDLTLLREIGIVAAGIGTSAAYLLYVPLHLRLCGQVVAIPYRALALTLARTLLAAGAAAGVLAMFGTAAELSVTTWAAGVIAAPAVYLAVLFATGELRRQELAGVAARVRRRSDPAREADPLG